MPFPPLHRAHPACCRSATRWAAAIATFAPHLTSAWVLLASPVARAQEGPVPPPPSPAPLTDVVPPHLASPSTVVYPPDATGRALVILAVTVNTDGTVRSSRSLEGAEPFASAAVQASLLWRFVPATRNGRPIAALIKMEVPFEPPTPPAAAEPPAPPTLPAPPTAAAPARRAPIEVVVHGDQRAPAVSSFSRAEVRQLPGAFGDPFRAIEVLPGVTPIISGLPFFYVRGAPPGNVGYFVDGVRVPYLFHAAAGPSVIHPGMVERVDLYPGGYPASFGRFAGGIVSGEATEPRQELHGEANIGLFDAGAMVETGFAGGRGTALVGGRYSYTAALVSLLAPTIDLAYHDYTRPASRTTSRPRTD